MRLLARPDREAGLPLEEVIRLVHTLGPQQADDGLLQPLIAVGRELQLERGLSVGDLAVAQGVEVGGERGSDEVGEVERQARRGPRLEEEAEPGGYCHVLLQLGHDGSIPVSYTHLTLPTSDLV